MGVGLIGWFGGWMGPGRVMNPQGAQERKLGHALPVWITRCGGECEPLGG